MSELPTATTSAIGILPLLHSRAATRLREESQCLSGKPMMISPPSEPGRSISVELRGSCEPFNTSQEYSFTFEDAKSGHVTTEWQPSAKATSAVGFLDLPKEIRDLIYHHISDDLHRTGVLWSISEQEKLPSGSHSLLAFFGHLNSVPPSNTSIMRTCRQVHFEFAEVLYGSPIQLHILVPCWFYTYYLPLSAGYAHLVTKIAFLTPTSWDSLPRDRWYRALQIANGLVKAFPNLRILRCGWEIAPVFDAWMSSSRAREVAEWREFDGEAELSRKSHIERIERFIRRARFYNELQIPHQFELFQLRDEEHVDTPFCEAVRNMRRTSSRGE